jgi:hypothetical protein
MKKYIWFFFLILYTHASDKPQYQLMTIVDLLPADAVTRRQSTTLEIKDTKKAVMKETRAVTIFSKKEEDEGVLVLWYNDNYSIEDLEGTLYDANGKKVKELDDDDIKDYSILEGASFHTDARRKIASLYHNEFPYTVEYTYEIKLNGSLNWPSWYAQPSRFPIEQSSLTVICPDDYTLRYWCNDSSVHPVVTKDGSDNIYQWSASHRKGIEEDAIGRSMFDVTTVVEIAPTDFQMDDYKGSMTTWKEFGLWNYRLYRDRMQLTPDAAHDITAHLQSGMDTLAMIKTLYEYMQSKTRYVSIQLGIGGWQPFDASYVHTHGYGDCKALSNYMCTILKYAGITAYPVIIHAGSNPDRMITEFPSNQFNHVIVCVPQPKDSVWLECTSSSMPFGRLSDFTEDRDALLITAKGGIVVHTPFTTAEQNLQRRTAHVSILANGNAQAEITTTLYENQQVDYQSALIDKSPKDREEWLMKRMEMPKVTLLSCSFEGLENHSPEITVSLSAQCSRYASVNGTRIFFNPNLLEKRTSLPPAVEKRLAPVRFEYPYVDKDSIVFSLPANYQLESIPHETNSDAPFASYSIKILPMADTAIVYVRRMEIKQSTIPAEQYNEYRNFISDIVKADRAQVVLKKK